MRAILTFVGPKGSYSEAKLGTPGTNLGIEEATSARFAIEDSRWASCFPFRRRLVVEDVCFLHITESLLLIKGFLPTEGIFFADRRFVAVEEFVREIVKKVLLLEIGILVVGLGARGEGVERRRHGDSDNRIRRQR